MQINQRKSKDVAQSHRGNNKFYSKQNGVHRSRRKEAWLRDGGRCVVCGKGLNLKTTQDNPLKTIGDHIVPREFLINSTPDKIRSVLASKGFDASFIEQAILDPDSLINYQTMCEKDHAKKSIEDKGYYVEAPIVRGNKDEEKSSMQCCICGSECQGDLRETTLGVWCIDCIED